ncbi:MAG: mechanosensitive ion channel family protein [Phycisphaerales bacterium]|nr:MAG: mechanosensitive ion channel family protein [Phycisphaerales bacterium]
MDTLRIRRRWMLSLLLILALAAQVHGQNAEEPAANGPSAPPPVPEGLESPAHTLRTFLEAMSAEPADYETGIGCLDLAEVPEDAGRQLAIKLYGIIIRIEDVEDESRQWRLTQSLSVSADETTLTFFPRPDDDILSGNDRRRHRVLSRAAGPDATIVFAKDDSGAWRFSAETVAAVDELYEKLRGQPVVASNARDERTLSSALWLEDHLPDWAMQRMLGLKYWQWLGLLVLIFIGIVLDFTVRFWLRIVSIRAIRRKGGEASPESLKRTVRPFGLAVMALFWLTVLKTLDLPPDALAVLLPAARFFFILAAVWALFKVTDLVGEVAATKAARTDTKFDDLLIPLVRKTIKIFITVFGLIYIADSLSISVVPLLTGLGIGGVGFAFAAKDTLEHIFGSITVVADRPFHVGDWVVIGDTEGTVEEVGIRSTRVRTFYNSLVTIPNGNLVRAVVDNYGRRKYRRWNTHLNLTYDTPPDRIEAFCAGLRELIRLHPYTRKDYYQIWLHQFGPSSLDVLLYVFWETPDWQTELRERHRLMMDIIRLADRLGVEFAFPTQTLHMYKEEPGGEHVPADAPEKAADFRAMRSGRSAVRELTANATWRDRKPEPYRFQHASETEAEDNGTQIESKIGGDG